MKVKLVKPNWYTGNPTAETTEALELLVGTWREAANHFALNHELKANLGKSAPLGIQPFLNAVIEERFLDSGWSGEDGRFKKKRTWFRITFRHQMSLGSDFLDAIRLPKSENIEQCVILAASDDFLRVITPRDWRSLCSFSKIAGQMAQLEGHITPPLIIGELSPVSQLSQSASSLIYGPRIRN